MGRTIDAGNLSAINSLRVEPVYLLELGFDVPVRLCSAGTVTWNGHSWIDAEMEIKLSDSPNITLFNEDQLLGTQVLSEVASGRTVNIYRMYGYTRRNLLRYTELLNSSWPTVGASKAEGPISIIGTRMRKLKEQANTGYHSTEQSLLSSDEINNSTLTFSIDAIPDYTNSVKNLSLIITNLAGGLRTARFNLANRTILAQPSGGSATIHHLGGGLLRCTVSASSGSGAGPIKAGIYLTSGSNLTYTADGTSSIYIGRPQIEYNAYPTDYQPVMAGQYTVTGNEPNGYTAPLLLYSGIIATPRVTAKQVKLSCRPFPPLICPKHTIGNPLCNFLPRAGQRFVTTRGVVVFGRD